MLGNEEHVLKKFTEHGPDATRVDVVQSLNIVKGGSNDNPVQIIQDVVTNTLVEVIWST